MKSSAWSPGDVKILWIVDEGTMVKKGDKLVELECGRLQEDVVRQRVSVATNQAEYDGSVENLEIQKSQNRSEQLRAKNALYMAQLDLEKYVSGDYKQKLREKESAIKLAEAELKRARDRLGWTEKLLKKGYVNRGEFEADQLAQTKQEIELERARNDKELLEKYEYKRELSQLETTKKTVRGRTEPGQAGVRERIAQQKNRGGFVKSPAGFGEVSTGQTGRPTGKKRWYTPRRTGWWFTRRRGGAWTIPIASAWGRRCTAIRKSSTCPDFSAWQVETRVHESRIQEVKMGQGALVSIDSFPGQTLDARVARIGMLPDSTRWYMPDTKEYLVNLDLTTTTLSLKPGMSVKAEVMLDSLEDVIYVPIQSVSTLNGHSAVWVKGEAGPAPPGSGFGRKQRPVRGGAQRLAPGRYHLHAIAGRNRRAGLRQASRRTRARTRTKNSPNARTGWERRTKAHPNAATRRRARPNQPPREIAKKRLRRQCNWSVPCV